MKKIELKDNRLIDIVCELNNSASILTELAQMAEEHRELKEGFWLALSHLNKGIKLLKQVIREQLK